MEAIKLKDINIYDIGNTIQIIGTIWGDNDLQFVTQFPDKDEDLSNLKKLPMSLDEWQKFIKQTDILETEIFNSDPTGIVKSIVRKTQRQIDSHIQWKCFKRDNYSCRYCGRTGLPLTVDHIDLWEDGGVPDPKNLITTCRSCNKDRGRIKYREWLMSKTYGIKSKNLNAADKFKNIEILNDLPEIEKMRVRNKRSR